MLPQKGPKRIGHKFSCLYSDTMSCPTRVTFSGESESFMLVCLLLGYFFLQVHKHYMCLLHKFCASIVCKYFHC